MNAAQLQALARFQLASPTDFAQSLEKALREHEGKRLRAEEDEPPEMRALKGVRMLNHANMMNQMQATLPVDLVHNSFTWAPPGQLAIPRAMQPPGPPGPTRVTLQHRSPSLHFSPTAQSVNAFFGVGGFPEHLNDALQQTEAEHLRENSHNMLGKFEVKLGAEQLSQIAAQAGHHASLDSQAGLDNSGDAEDGDTVQRRRVQNREASARFRARGKARDQELVALKNDVALLESRNKELKQQVEELRPASAPLTRQQVLSIQENTILWVMSKFRLKRKTTFRALALAVMRTMGLYNAARRRSSTQAGAASVAPAPLEQLEATTDTKPVPSSSATEPPLNSATTDDASAVVSVPRPPLPAAFQTGDEDTAEEKGTSSLPPINTRQTVSKPEPVRGGFEGCSPSYAFASATRVPLFTFPTRNTTSTH